VHCLKPMNWACHIVVLLPRTSITTAGKKAWMRSATVYGTVHRLLSCSVGDLMSTMSMLLLSIAKSNLSATSDGSPALSPAAVPVLRRAGRLCTQWIALEICPAFPCLPSERIRRVINVLLFLPEPSRPAKKAADAAASDGGAAGGAPRPVADASVKPKNYLVKEELKEQAAVDALQSLAKLVRLLGARCLQMC
jgi:hypothetical protein